MFESLKQKLAWVGVSLLSLAGLILGLKLRKLKVLEAEKRAQDLESEVKGIREQIQEHRKVANDKEKELRSQESELRQAIRNARAARKPDGDEPPPAA